MPFSPPSRATAIEQKTFLLQQYIPGTFSPRISFRQKFKNQHVIFRYFALPDGTAGVLVKILTRRKIFTKKKRKKYPSKYIQERKRKLQARKKNGTNINEKREKNEEKYLKYLLTRYVKVSLAFFEQKSRGICKDQKKNFL